MKPVIRNARAAAGLIVILLAGCDNVSFGGADVAVVPPPPRAADVPDDVVEGGVEALPASPVLYYVARTADGAYMTPIGAIAGDSLTPIRSEGDPETFAGRFVAEFMREGGEFTLFHRGRRAGTFIVHGTSMPEQPACPLLPMATGALELPPNVAATEFLALARADAPSVPARTAPPETTNRMRNVVAPILAERIIRRRGAELPGSWARANAQVLAFPASNVPDPGFTATFLVGDQLGPGPQGGARAHSVFYIAVPTRDQTGYDTVYVSHRNYAETGKMAPRVVDYLDWSRDDQPELLLQVYGQNDMWFEAVGRGSDGSWRRIFSDRCEDGGRRLPAPVQTDGQGGAGGQPGGGP
ncbi:MAG TPA: hypothetical protein VK929_14590 [Longimicrobiales bacterium]|nr:hypothetical protein [Longimicrobiales bacterium]